MSERLPKELHLFHRGDTVAIMNKNRREVVAWTGFDSSDFPKCMRPKIARRIVATWNACAGIPTEMLEEGPLIAAPESRLSTDSVKAGVSQATADEALTLLRNLKEICRHASSRDAQTAGEACMTVVKTVSAFLEARK